MSTTATTSAVTGTWVADPVHSNIGFTVPHLVSTFRAGFGDVDASYDADAGTLRGSVPASSIEVRQDDLRGHLLSAEFFAAEEHPEITFTSSAFRHLGEGRIEVDGELKIKGVAKQVTATGTLSEPGPSMQGGEAIAIALTTVVDRRDYGLDWNVELPGNRLTVGWDVTLDVVLELHRAEA